MPELDALAPATAVPAYPVGMVTFLFTDIEGGARLRERDRDAIAHHNAILDAAIAAHDAHLDRCVDSVREGYGTFRGGVPAHWLRRCDAEQDNFRAALDPEPFAAAWAAGRALPREQAVEEALALAVRIAALKPTPAPAELDDAASWLVGERLSTMPLATTTANPVSS